MGNELKIVRREQSARSHEHHGILTQVIFESDSLEVLRTEMEAGTACDCEDFGDHSAVHYVIDGTPVFRTSLHAADLMPGDSIVFSGKDRYTVSNCAPSRSVILSVLFRSFATEARA